jgi:hypothetical protein
MVLCLAISFSLEKVSAILAPKGYMKEHGLTIAPKERVTVTGPLISVLGKTFILAMEAEGDRVMKLRETNGCPAEGGELPGGTFGYR